MTIRVLVADDHPLVSAGISAMLDAEPDIVLAGRTGTDDVLGAAIDLAPDVIVVDPAPGPADLIAKLAANSAARVLVLTDTRDVASMGRALTAGAAGYLLKINAAQALPGAVRAIVVAGTVLDPGLIDDLVEDLFLRPVAGTRGRLITPLTARETEVLLHLAEGLSDAEISRRLFISFPTVRTHIGRVLMKLTARNRAHAVTIAYRLGLVRIASPDC
jgi:DNA-binding NarL/FixJ family response regulator